MDYEVVIGMEVHVEIGTKSKVFCGCDTNFHADANTNVCPVCLGLPGVLPVLNRGMVEATVAVGLALDCTISRWSKMDRKNYFYPDLSKNYQISQYDLPLCYEGRIPITVNGEEKIIGITRAHMEEDTARNVHTIGGGRSGVDYNRCGLPLLEIVTEPDIRSAEEAHQYLLELKQLLEYLGVSDCNMEEGSLRAEANISLRPKGATEFGTKVEVKNVASFSGVYKAIEYEVARQREVLEEGGTLVQETRGWDADKGITFSQRGKESAHDYRYFPEPDLVPIVVDEAWEQQIRETLPELPRLRRQRFQTDYELSEYDADVLCATKDMANFFETVVQQNAPAKKAANWLMGDLQAMLVAAKQTLSECPITAENLAAMIAMIEDGTISGKIGKDVLAEMFVSGKAPRVVVEEKGLVQISDEGELESVIRELVAANPGPADDFRGGNQKAIGFFMGQLMKATKGKANPKLANTLLQKILKEG